jgi:hypothetical protein
MLHNLRVSLPALQLLAYKYSKPWLIRLQLIWMSDNPDRNMRNSVHTWVNTLKDTWHSRRQMSHLSVQTKLETVSSNLHYYVKKQVQLLPSHLSMNKCIVFLQFLNEVSTVMYLFIFINTIYIITFSIYIFYNLFVVGLGYLLLH